MILIKFDSVSPNCSANKHTQSNCSDKIKWTSYSTWIKMESEELWTQQKQSLKAFVLMFCEFQSCKFQNVIERWSVQLATPWEQVTELQKHVSAVSDGYLNRSTKYARVCIACPGFLIRKHFYSCSTDFTASYHSTQLSFSDFISATLSKQGICFP